MSWNYSITIRIDAPYTEGVIQDILEKAPKLDIICYKHMDEEGIPLNAKDAAHSVFQAANDSEIHCVDAKVQGIYVALHFIENYGQVTVMFSGISYERIKKFKYDHEDIDIAFYAKTLLDLTQDFRILEMHINKD